MKISLLRACEAERTLLTNMFQLYLHELSEYTDHLDINKDGIFENTDIETYYNKDALMPIIIQCNGTIVGFILLNTPPYAPKGYDYYINDIFVLKKFRGTGIGKAAANELFCAYPGKFAMVQLAKNIPAITFWKKILTGSGYEYEEKEIVQDDELCIFQGFDVTRTE